MSGCNNCNYCVVCGEDNKAQISDLEKEIKSLRAMISEARPYMKTFYCLTEHEDDVIFTSKWLEKTKNVKVDQ